MLVGLNRFFLTKYSNWRHPAIATDGHVPMMGGHGSVFKCICVELEWNMRIKAESVSPVLKGSQLDCWP